jgi:hypothetical protein
MLRTTRGLAPGAPPRSCPLISQCVLRRGCCAAPHALLFFKNPMAVFDNTGFY